MPHWASANRDPEHFERPDECVLARLEMRVALEELLARTTSIELSDTPIRTTFIRQGVSYLPLTFRA